MRVLLQFVRLALGTLHVVAAAASGPSNREPHSIWRTSRYGTNSAFCIAPPWNRSSTAILSSGPTYKHAFVKQYEKFSTFLRNEVCSNNLADFNLKKGLEHLAAVREKFLAITDRFATFQAQCLNVHVEFLTCLDFLYQP